jgi:hypothetical protein
MCNRSVQSSGSDPGFERGGGAHPLRRITPMFGMSKREGLPLNPGSSTLPPCWSKYLWAHLDQWESDERAPTCYFEYGGEDCQNSELFRYRFQIVFNIDQVYDGWRVKLQSISHYSYHVCQPTCYSQLAQDKEG